MVINYCISVLYPLLYNFLEIFIFLQMWKISKIWYFDIFENMIFSNPGIIHSRRCCNYNIQNSNVLSQRDDNTKRHTVSSLAIDHQNLMSISF